MTEPFRGAIMTQFHCSSKKKMAVKTRLACAPLTQFVMVFLLKQNEKQKGQQESRKKGEFWHKSPLISPPDRQFSGRLSR